MGEAAEAGYIKTMPYHNWFHAVDVTHAVYRFMQLCSADAYFSNLERFALLVSATAHDIGHIGLNNSFLTETAHELAIRYNDKSPLENMHSAKLFELLASPKTNIFSAVSGKQFKDLRKVCVDAILHTDNTQHFIMIKEVEVMFEVNSDSFSGVLEEYALLPDTFPNSQVATCFRKPETRHLLVKVYLHLAYISNSMKPFKVCRIWAWKVLEEFFLQGDEEKRLGVPIQALNDREKVNRPFSQVNFIEFLVAPLAFAVVKVLPPSKSYIEHMLSNLETWHNVWLEETRSSTSEQEGRAVGERIAKLRIKFEAMIA